jgi:FMN phosphatase YigB (HAD superfamily)
MIGAIIFDLDTSIIDFLTFKVESAKSAAREMVRQGLNSPELTLYGKIFSIYEKEGLDYQKTFHDTLIPFNLSPDDFERIQQSAIGAYLKRKFETLKPFPSVKSTLFRFPLNIKKIGISLSPRNKVWQRLVITSLENDFSLVLSKDTSPNTQDLIKLSLGQLGIHSSEALFVSSDEKKLAAAKNLSLKTCFTKYGSLRKPQSSWDYTIDSFDQLVSIL